MRRTQKAADRRGDKGAANGEEKKIQKANGAETEPSSRVGAEFYAALLRTLLSLLLLGALLPVALCCGETDALWTQWTLERRRITILEEFKEKTTSVSSKRTS
ncbi:hypothetical protein CRENBAI_013110 [Crenichthys baileyi]|uniref:Uncharacterized protein n=1 Tax=Crenichthys baileyi TaxID=28760 RepID=A0AAV9RAB1_9TELE